MLLRVTEAAAARRWLTKVADQITTSERKQEGLSLNVAFTHLGLRHLGLDDETLATFSRPFLEGMTTTHRSRILGDAAENAPAYWNWGGDDEKKAVDILLLLFAVDENTLEAVLAARRAELVQSGIAELQTLGAGRQSDSHEHFGFADGMGQPAIEGSTQAERAAARNIIKAGEFLLSYTNDYGKPADSPMVKAARDPNGLLPPAPTGDSVTGVQTGVHDLGRNGTYLVFRQLAQDVALFRRFVDEATRRPDGHLDHAIERPPRGETRRTLAEWRASLLSPYADDPALSDADDFGYRDSDAHGFNCPIGSHIRRSNPRDTLGPDGAIALASANRHRILRRGRSYGHRPEDPRVGDGVDRGLLFLCLNSDIERQFEFVQQTWVNNPVFGGLNGEVDPLIGNISKTETLLDNSNHDNPENGHERSDALFTVQADPLRTRIHNVERFVTVKGGAYFFLPSIRALRYLASL